MKIKRAAIRDESYEDQRNQLIPIAEAGAQGAPSKSANDLFK